MKKLTRMQFCKRCMITYYGTTECIPCQDKYLCKQIKIKQEGDERELKMKTFDAGLVMKYHKIIPFLYMAIRCPECNNRTVHHMFYQNQTGDDFFKCFSCGHHFES